MPALPVNDSLFDYLMRRSKDYGVTALKGAVAVPEAAIGLMDIPTGGAVGKAIEDYTPLQIAQTQKILDTWYSPEQQAANKAVADAEGFLATVGTAIQNPSTIAHATVESLPLMLAGGAVGRGLGALGKAAPQAAKLFTNPMAAAAAGEGIVGAGSAAESIRGMNEDRELTPGQSLAAIGSGVGTAGFGFLGNKAADALGIGDIDTAIVRGMRKKAAEEGTEAVTKPWYRRAAEGAFSEGVLEEMPQSIQETMWQNVATGKDLMEGAGNAAAMGMLSGGLMGGPFAVYHQAKQNREIQRQEFNDQVNAHLETIRQEREAAKAQEVATGHSPVSLTDSPTLEESQEALKAEEQSAAAQMTIDQENQRAAVDQQKIDNNLQFQLQGMAEANDVELDNHLKGILESKGVSVNVVDDLRSKYGMDAVGVADTLNKVVEVAQNRKLDTLPEEAVHMALSLIGQSATANQQQKQLAALMRDIHSWDGYQEVVNQYAQAYEGNEERIRFEAVGKLVTQSLLKQNKAKNSFVIRAKEWLKSALDWVRSAFGDTRNRDARALAKGVYSGNFELGEEQLQPGVFASKQEKNEYRKNEDYIKRMESAEKHESQHPYLAAAWKIGKADVPARIKENLKRAYQKRATWNRIGVFASLKEKQAPNLREIDIIESTRHDRFDKFVEEDKAVFSGGVYWLKDSNLVTSAGLAGTSPDGRVYVDLNKARAFWGGKDNSLVWMKEPVFKRMGITADQFRQIFDTQKDFNLFLARHEKAHIFYEDHKNYVKSKHGKYEVNNDKNIDMEIRATFASLTDEQKARYESLVGGEASQAQVEGQAPTPNQEQATAPVQDENAPTADWWETSPAEIVAEYRERVKRIFEEGDLFLLPKSLYNPQQESGVLDRLGIAFNQFRKFFESQDEFVDFLAAYEGALDPGNKEAPTFISKADDPAFAAFQYFLPKDIAEKLAAKYPRLSQESFPTEREGGKVTRKTFKAKTPLTAEEREALNKKIAENAAAYREGYRYRNVTEDQRAREIEANSQEAQMLERDKEEADTVLYEGRSVFEDIPEEDTAAQLEQKRQSKRPDASKRSVRDEEDAPIDPATEARRQAWERNIRVIESSLTKTIVFTDKKLLKENKAALEDAKRLLDKAAVLSERIEGFDENVSSPANLILAALTEVSPYMSVQDVVGYILAEETKRASTAVLPEQRKVYNSLSDLDTIPEALDEVLSIYEGLTGNTSKWKLGIAGESEEVSPLARYRQILKKTLKSVDKQGRRRTVKYSKNKKQPNTVERMKQYYRDMYDSWFGEAKGLEEMRPHMGLFFNAIQRILDSNQKFSPDMYTSKAVIAAMSKFDSAFAALDEKVQQRIVANLARAAQIQYGVFAKRTNRTEAFEEIKDKRNVVFEVKDAKTGASVFVSDPVEYPVDKGFKEQQQRFFQKNVKYASAKFKVFPHTSPVKIAGVTKNEFVAETIEKNRMPNLVDDIARDYRTADEVKEFKNKYNLIEVATQPLYDLKYKDANGNDRTIIAATTGEYQKLKDETLSDGTLKYKNVHVVRSYKKHEAPIFWVAVNNSEPIMMPSFVFYEQERHGKYKSAGQIDEFKRYMEISEEIGFDEQTGEAVYGEKKFIPEAEYKARVASQEGSGLKYHDIKLEGEMLADFSFDPMNLFREVVVSLAKEAVPTKVYWSKGGFEVSTQNKDVETIQINGKDVEISGADFAAVRAKLPAFSWKGEVLKDWTIEELYQIVMKGHYDQGKRRADLYKKVDGKTRLNDEITGKLSVNGKTEAQMWSAYQFLWKEWAKQQAPEKLDWLRKKAKEHGGNLTDSWAKTRINQARALASLLNETAPQPYNGGDFAAEEGSEYTVDYATYLRMVDTYGGNNVELLEDSADQLSAFEIAIALGVQNVQQMLDYLTLREKGEYQEASKVLLQAKIALGKVVANQKLQEHGGQDFFETLSKETGLPVEDIFRKYMETGGLLSSFARNLKVDYNSAFAAEFKKKLVQANKLQEMDKEKERKKRLDGAADFRKEDEQEKKRNDVLTAALAKISANYTEVQMQELENYLRKGNQGYVPLALGQQFKDDLAYIQGELSQFYTGKQNSSLADQKYTQGRSVGLFDYFSPTADLKGFELELSGRVEYVGKLQNKIAQTFYNLVAKLFNADLVIVADDEYRSRYIGKASDGRSKIVVNVRAKRNFSSIFAHELFHHIVTKLAPEDYARFKRIVLGTMDSIAYDSLIDRLQTRHDISKAEAEEEVLAELFANVVFRWDFYKSLAKTTKGNVVARSLLTRLLDKASALTDTFAGMKINDAQGAFSFEGQILLNKEELADIYGLFGDMMFGSKSFTGINKNLDPIVKEAFETNWWESPQEEAPIPSKPAPEKMVRLPNGLLVPQKTYREMKEAERKVKERQALEKQADSRIIDQIFPNGVKSTKDFLDGVENLFKLAGKLLKKYSPNFAYTDVGSDPKQVAILYDMVHSPKLATYKAQMQIAEPHRDAFKGMGRDALLLLQDMIFNDSMDFSNENHVKLAMHKGIPASAIEALKAYQDTVAKLHEQLVEYYPDFKPKNKFGQYLQWEKDGVVTNKDIDWIFDPDKSALERNNTILKDRPPKSPISLVSKGLSPRELNPHKVFLRFVEDANKLIAVRSGLAKMLRTAGTDKKPIARIFTSFEDAAREGYNMVSDAATDVVARMGIKSYKIKMADGNYLVVNGAESVYSSEEDAQQEIENYLAFERSLGLEPEVPVVEEITPQRSVSAYAFRIYELKPDGTRSYSQFDAGINNVADVERRVELLRKKMPGKTIEYERVLGDINKTKVAKLYFQKDAARMLNVLCARDLIRDRKVGKGLMAIKNKMTQLEFAFSAFHMMTIGQELSAAYAPWAMKTKAKGLGVIPVVNLFQAQKESRELAVLFEAVMASPDISKDERIKAEAKRLLHIDNVDILEAANAFFMSGNVYGLDPDLRTSVHSTGTMQYTNKQDKLKLTNKGVEYEYGGPLDIRPSAISNSFKKFYQEQLDELPEGPLKKTMAGINAVQFGAFEATTSWLMEYTIPRMKLAMFLREYTLKLDQHKAAIEAGSITKADIARDTTKFIEDRFGEVNWQNMWMNPTMKTALQFLFRSFTWFTGSWKALGKAGADLTKWGWFNVVRGGIGGNEYQYKLTEKGLWGINAVLSHAMTVGLVGAIYMVFLGGGDDDEVPTPEETAWLTMALFPRVDKFDATARMSIPSYVTEAYKIFRHVGVIGNEAEYSKLITGRVNSLLGKGYEAWWDGADWRGVAIIDHNDILLKQVFDRMVHTFSIAPISFNTMYDSYKQKGFDPGEIFFAGLGFTGAPAAAKRTNATNKAFEIRRLENAGKTVKPEDDERRTDIKRAMYKVQSGDYSEIKELVAQGQISQNGYIKALQRIPLINKKPNPSYIDPLSQAIKPMTIVGAIEVWGYMNEGEKKKHRPEIVKKFMNMMKRKDKSPEEKKLIAKALKEAKIV